MQRAKLLFWGGIWAVINFASAIALYFIFGQSYFFRLDFGGIYIPRLTDFMVSVLWPMAFVYYIYSQNRKQKIFLMLTLVFGFIVIILGFFRSIWLGVVASWVLVFYFKRKRFKEVKLVLSLSVLALLLIISVSLIVQSNLFSETGILGLISERMSSESLNEGSSYLGRLKTYVALFTGSLDPSFLITGHGFGSSFVVEAIGKDIMPISSSPNFFLNIAYEMGYIAFFVFTLIMSVVFSRLRLIYRCPQSLEDEKLSLALIAAAFATGVTLTTFPTLLHFPITPVFGVGLALAFLASERENKAKCNSL